MRPRLIYNESDHLAWGPGWMTSYYSDYFDLVKFNPADSYAITDVMYISYMAEQHESWWKPYYESGHRLIVEHLWDSDVDTLSSTDGSRLLLRCPNWIWYYSCIEWHHHGYTQYQPDRNYQYDFLLMINKQREHRDQIIEQLAPRLDRALYSYVERGRNLPNDITKLDQVPWVTYFNPAWYNSTCYSVVAESYMRSDSWFKNPENYKTEVSEKLFKPIAGQQPFIVYGSVDTLTYLHREGFVTFDNLFDESYDQVPVDTDRLLKVTDIVNQAVDNYPREQFRLDAPTSERIAHNRNRLYDLDLVNRRFRKEITDVILEFIAQ